MVYGNVLLVGDERRDFVHRNQLQLTMRMSTDVFSLRLEPGFSCDRIQGGTNETRLLIVIMIGAALLGGVMSSTAVVAIFIPIVLRIAAEADASSAYHERCQRAVSVMEHDEQNGADPRRLAELLERIIADPAPRPRYPIGALGQRLAVAARRFVPTRLLDKALSGLYKI